LATKELAAASRQRAVSHLLSHQGFFFPKSNMPVVPHPPYISMHPQLKVKLKGRHFDATEVIEAESQAVLNSLPEHDFQDAFRNGRSAYFECESRELAQS
jgi:hypothetical protein